MLTHADTQATFDRLYY